MPMNLDVSIGGGRRGNMMANQRNMMTQRDMMAILSPPSYLNSFAEYYGKLPADLQAFSRVDTAQVRPER